MCNVPVQSLAADDAQMKVASFVPLLSDILQTFAPGVVTCCFCHLPANYLPGLGDLYGPYSPTFRDLTHYRELAQQNINVKTENPPDFISEITMDVDKKICFITTSTKSCTNKKKTVLSAGVPTAKEVEQSVSAMSPQLRIMHTLDYLLIDPKKTSRKHHNNERSGKFRIPGFSGNLNLKSSGSANSTENNTNLKKLMPGIETIVFIEPQDDTIPSKSPEKVSVTSPKRRKSAASKLSDNITATHMFNTSD
uniref:Uncharacterized protein n=1 Tax=Ciona savignyi TaxID=51511 RepID=H2Z784_CIOSA